MLRVSSGHYRDSFRRVVYDVYRVRQGVWSYRAVGQNAIGLNLGPENTRRHETKYDAERAARSIINHALREAK